MSEQEIINRLNKIFKYQRSGIITRKEFPELASVAPACGERYTVGPFVIVHNKVDELDQFTIFNPTHKPIYCEHCERRVLGPKHKCPPAHP